MLDCMLRRTLSQVTHAADARRSTSNPMHVGGESWLVATSEPREADSLTSKREFSYKLTGGVRVPRVELGPIESSALVLNTVSLCIQSEISYGGGERGMLVVRRHIVDVSSCKMWILHIV